MLCSMYNCSLDHTGCDLSEGCSASDISDQLCSVGRELTCQCQYPHVAGDGNICYDGKHLL